MNNPSIPTQTVLDGLDHLAKGGLTTQGIFDLVFAAKAKIVELSKNDKRNLTACTTGVGDVYGEMEAVLKVQEAFLAPKQTHERYLAFSGTNRDGQGWHGYRGAWPTTERCLVEILRHDNDWWHIIDSRTMQIIDLG